MFKFVLLSSVNGTRYRDWMNNGGGGGNDNGYDRKCVIGLQRENVKCKWRVRTHTQKSNRHWRKIVHFIIAMPLWKSLVYLLAMDNLHLNGKHLNKKYHFNLRLYVHFLPTQLHHNRSISLVLCGCFFTYYEIDSESWLMLTGICDFRRLIVVMWLKQKMPINIKDDRLKAFYLFHSQMLLKRKKIRLVDFSFL